jgi:hypothetical protein
MLSGHRLSVIVLAAGLSGCAQEPGVYSLPLHDAYERLAHNTFDGFKLARQCGILIHISPEPIQDESIIWRVFSSDEEQVSFTARLSAVGDKKTKVTVEVSQDPDGTEAYDGKDFYPHPAFRQPLKPAVEEAIAATLENRPFDVAKVVDIPGDNQVCNIQRGGLESTGRAFSVHDKAGEWGGREE